MRAALVDAFGQSPRWGEIAEPTPGPDEVRVKVRASALSQLVQSQVAGKHYTSGPKLPFVPGADGVGVLDDGRRVYFAFPRTGAMAEVTVAARAHVAAVPASLDDVTAAAIANPAMSSWAALKRAGFVAGQSVLVNGATGASGSLAVKIARHRGARRVVATGRNRDVLASLGADATIALDGSHDELRARFHAELASIDVVLDYVWGLSAQAIVEAASGLGPRRIRFVNIGSMAGADVTVPAHAVRNSGLELLGSGFGSVSTSDLVGAIAEFFAACEVTPFSIETAPVPMSEVAAAWTRPAAARTVFTLP